MKINRTLSRAVDILELLSKNKDGYSLSQLAAMLDCPKSSVFDIIKTLVYKNMVIEDTQSGNAKYKIGLQAFLIGNSFVQNVDMINTAKKDLIDLANQMHATTFMAVMDDFKVTYIYKYESQNSIITTANIGTRGLLHSTGLGKVLLAFANEDLFKAALKRINYESLTPYTLTSPEALFEEIKRVRVKGYAIDDRENSLYQCCAAAPVRNHQGEMIAAVSCSGLHEVLTDLDALGQIVRSTADRISAQLGYVKKENEA